jgi:hypothetical protein
MQIFQKFGDIKFSENFQALLILRQSTVNFKSLLSFIVLEVKKKKQ